MTETVGLLLILGFGSLGVWVRMGGRRRLAQRVRSWWQARRSARSEHQRSHVQGDEV